MKRIFTFLAILATTSFAFGQTVYYQETLNDGLPMDWTADGEWTIGAAGDVSSQYFTVPASDGNVACFNDDGAGNGHVGDGTITTGMIDLTDVSGALILEMNSYFLDADYGGADERAIIRVSTDGVDWEDLLDLPGEGAFTLITADMSAYAGQSIMLQFYYDDGAGWNFGWAFDNVTLSDQITLIPSRSYAVHAGPAVMMDQAAEGAAYVNQGWVFNNGLDDMTSFDLNWSNGTDQFSTSVSGVTIPFGGFYKYDAPEAITVSGNQTWTVSISNVNGSMDDDDNTADDEMSFNLNGLANLNSDKAVVVEEATGTWCPWCTRGTTFLDEMSARFPDNFVGIAVHNNDPMAIAAYDGAITSFPGFTGFPSVVYQRESILDPSAIVAPSIADMQTAPVASITVGAEMASGALTTSVEVNFLEDVNQGEYNVAIVVTEDDVTGTGAGWGQANAYAGGGNGEMGGYELLGGTVEGIDYDHVGIGLVGDYAGIDLAPVTDFITGDIVGQQFDAWNIPTGSVMENMYLVGLLIDSNGEIVNAKAVKIAEALDNGLFVSGTNDLFDATLAEIFPNPVTDNAFVTMNLDETAEITVTVLNSLGQVIETTRHGKMSGAIQLPINMSDYAAGMYSVNVTAGDRFFTQKVTKN